MIRLDFWTGILVIEVGLVELTEVFTEVFTEVSAETLERIKIFFMALREPR